MVMEREKDCGEKIKKERKKKVIKFKFCLNNQGSMAKKCGRKSERREITGRE